MPPVVLELIGDPEAFFSPLLFSHGMEELIEHVLKLDARQQSAHAKKLADFMYDVYTTVHLLEEAHYDLQNTGENRRMIIAEHWYRVRFDRSDRGILQRHHYG
ncbi:hypothetical protein [Fictibacillus sp. NRS-1165]|uniref:hypothetical protein n=1 Tax=Fictibacillus sp. NRS-1165 TaxID=3144463 RepID=UPI003D208DBB